MSFFVNSTIVINTSRDILNTGTFTQTGAHNNDFAAASGTFPHVVGINVDRGTLYRHVQSSGIPCFFQVNSGSSTSGSISVSGGSTAFNTSSDYRMKENVVDLNKNEALTKILSTRPVTFDWKLEHGGQSGIGFIAHELQEVAPECVSGEKDAVTVNDEIVPQAVDSSWLIPSICATLQKQQELLDLVESELNLLRGN